MSGFPIESVRAQFPALNLTDGERSRVYLDNPAGTQVPQRVIDGVANAMVTSASNIGGEFSSSKASGEIWEKAHASMATLLGGSEQEVIIGPNMSTLTFNMSRTLGQLMKAGDEIIVTRMDHESDISPWLHLAKDLNLEIKWLPFNKETWRIEAEDLKATLTDRTRLLALNYASNLTGSINDVKTLTAIAKDAGALVYVDAVQFAPHGLIDVGELGCDFLVASAYKFYGPHMGVLWGKKELLSDLEAYKCRCAAELLPEKFETGTAQIEMMGGLIETVNYLASLGTEASLTGGLREQLDMAYTTFCQYENTLAKELIAGLNGLSGVTIHGITSESRLAERVPTISFTHDRMQPLAIAKSMAAEGICIWHGHNYAYEPVRQLGLDEESGVVRIGLAHYNTMDEVEMALSALEHLLN